MIIDRNNAIEHEIHRYIAEASSLGIAPGKWPKKIQTELGNRQAFILTGFEEEDGDVISASYKQALGCILLKILND